MNQQHIITKKMDACFGAFNTKGFAQSLNSNQLPSQTHLTYGGLFNELNFSVGPKAKKPLEIFLGYARAQNQKSAFDTNINDYLTIFTKGNKDGQDRDQRVLNSVIILDISGSMGSGLTRSGEGCRIQLAKEAILMFFSKLRPNDSFGLVLFNNSAQTVIPVSRVSELNFEDVATKVRAVHAGGGTTLMEGFNEAHQQLKKYTEKAESAKGAAENRMIMLTDVCDNSFSNAQQFIGEVGSTDIHTTIIGVSDDFQSDVCESLVEVKGFNYFCATEVDDLKKYLFENFSFTFFPANYDISVEIQSDLIESIEVFGTVDADKVDTYNVNATDTFVVTHTKTSFPSELEVSQDGTVKTYGGLMLVKLKLKPKENTAFDAKIKLKYTTVAGEHALEQYPVHYESPVNEQFFSDQSLYEALSAFFYGFECKSILGEANECVGNTENYGKYAKALESMKELVPKSKLGELEKLIKSLKAQSKQAVKDI